MCNYVESFFFVQYLADERLKHSNEILQGIKLLKSYGWEQLYVQVVEKIRLQELNHILRMNVGYGVIGSFSFLMMKVVMVFVLLLSTSSALLSSSSLLSLSYSMSLFLYFKFHIVSTNYLFFTLHAGFIVSAAPLLVTLLVSTKN